MAERPHVMGDPPHGGRFRLVREGKYTHLVGMILRGPEGKEREEEVNLLPGTGTKAVFVKTPKLLLEDGSTAEVAGKEALLCKLDSGTGPEDAFLFPRGALLLNWFAPEQEVILYPHKLEAGRNPYYKLA